MNSILQNKKSGFLALFISVNTEIEIHIIQHGIIWSLRNRRARKEQPLLFYLLKAFDEFGSSQKSDIFSRKDLFSFMRAQHGLSYHLIQGP